MKKLKIMTDCVMMILLPLLMAYALIGEDIHEWLGIVMFGMFIFHHILNRRWFVGLFKGKYTPLHIYTNVLNILLCIIMLALPISGILMSKHAVPFLSIKNGASLARTVHMTSSYWGFVLMSLHLGNHAGLMMNGMRKMFRIRNDSTARTVILRIIAGLISAYGIYAFIKRKIASYLFMQAMFAFFNFGESRLGFFADYIAMMIMFGAAGHYTCKLLKGTKKHSEETS